ncbi:MAG: hypothetical protein Kow00107_00240 [Planctomycetota bacterium]
MWDHFRLEELVVSDGLRDGQRRYVNKLMGLAVVSDLHVRSLLRVLETVKEMKDVSNTALQEAFHGDGTRDTGTTVALIMV